MVHQECVSPALRCEECLTAAMVPRHLPTTTILGKLLRAAPEIHISCAYYSVWCGFHIRLCSGRVGPLLNVHICGVGHSLPRFAGLMRPWCIQAACIHTSISCALTAALCIAYIGLCVCWSLRRLTVSVYSL